MEKERGVRRAQLSDNPLYPTFIEWGEGKDRLTDAVEDHLAHDLKEEWAMIAQRAA